MARLQKRGFVPDPIQRPLSPGSNSVSASSPRSRLSVLSQPPVYSPPRTRPPSYTSRQSSNGEPASLRYWGSPRASDDDISVVRSDSNVQSPFRKLKKEKPEGEIKSWRDGKKRPLTDERLVADKKPLPLPSVPESTIPIEPQRRPPRGLMCFGLCWVNTKICCIIAGVVCLVVLIAAIVPPVVIFYFHNKPAQTSPESTATVVVTATVTSTPTPTPTPSEPWALGGFDTLRGQSLGDPVFYTDRSGNVVVIDEPSTMTWEKGDPFIVADDAVAGSPVQAVLDTHSQAHIAYISQSGELRGVSTSYSSGHKLWYNGTINLLGLAAANDSFLRMCDVPTNTAYYLTANGTALPVVVTLMFRGKDGGIKRYGASYDTKAGTYSLKWFVLNETLPFYSSARIVECSYDTVGEGMWVVTGNQTLEYWVKTNTKNGTLGSRMIVTEWNKVYTGSQRTLRDTGLLAMTSGAKVSTGRQHLIYQDELTNLVRLDLTGLGKSVVITQSEIMTSATGGTRLATWTTSGYCEDDTRVYYQSNRTSALYYVTFIDRDYGGTYMGNTILLDRKMPIVTTWGDVVEPGVNGVDTGTGSGGSGTSSTNIGNIVGIVIGVLIAISILFCCCRG